MNELTDGEAIALPQDRVLLLAESAGFARLLMLLFGALGYGLLEIFWRGYTHWSMLAAGGICLLAIDCIDRNVGGISDRAKAFCAALLITAVELLLGLVFNILLERRVWDYTAVPFNFYGQICLPFFLVWLGLAYIIIKSVRRLRRAF